jgi:hypothetical protein
MATGRELGRIVRIAPGKPARVLSTAERQAVLELPWVQEVMKKYPAALEPQEGTAQQSPMDLAPLSARQSMGGEEQIS